jgi:hypothetical protein
MRVLVCGGRDYTNMKVAAGLLDRVHALRPITCIIQGDARGADSLAKTWAMNRGIQCDSYPANWNKFGKQAGYIRNIQMLEEGKPAAVIAFPGGRGTGHMMGLALAEGLPVLDVKDLQNKM